jgi:hypothetical protein
MPEVPNFSADTQALLSLVLSDPAALLGLSTRELDLALRLARRARVLGRLAAHLESTGRLAQLPPTAQEQLRSALVMVEARARATRWELRCLARALESAEPMRAIALKGCAYLLSGLPNAVGRIFADVDLLFEERDLGRAEQALMEYGWQGKEITAYDQNYYRAWTHELPPLIHDEREIEADLHHNIIARTSRLKPSAELLLAAARPIPDTRFQRLSDEDVVLHAMTHLLFDSDMADCIRDLVDIDDLLRHFSSNSDAFWDTLWERAERLDLTRPAYYALRYAKSLLGTPVPERALLRSRSGAPPPAIVWLMDRLVPLALFPVRPDRPSRVAAPARLCLYVRSLWIRMPPWLLTRHLSYKAYVRVRSGLRRKS